MQHADTLLKFLSEGYLHAMFGNIILLILRKIFALKKSKLLILFIYIVRAQQKKPMHQLFLSLVVVFRQCRGRSGGEGYRLTLPAAIAVALDHVHGCVIEDPVQCAEQ